MASHHRVSDFLCDRWPILPSVREDGSKSISLAYGDRIITKLHDRIISGEISEAEMVDCLSLLRDECVKSERAVEAVRAGVVQDCIEASLFSNSKIRLAGLQLAARLLVNAEGRVILSGYKQGVDTIANICLSDEVEEVRVAAADTLSAYVYHLDARTMLVSSHATSIKTIVDALHATPACFRVLSTILSNSASAIMPLLMKTDFIKNSTNLQSRLTSKNLKDCLQGLCSALRDPEAKRQALANNTHVVLAAVEEDSDIEVFLSRLQCILLISEPPEGKQAILDDCKPAFLVRMAKLLEHADARIQYAAADILRSTAGLPAAKDTIVSLLASTPSHCHRVFGEEAHVNLVSLLDSEHAVVASGALQSLLYSLKRSADPGNFAKQILSCLHADEMLRRIAGGCFPRAAVSVSETDRSCAQTLLQSAA